MTPKIRLTLASILALVALGAIAPAANAYVYWSNAGTNSITRASLDGTGTNQPLITSGGYPRGVAVEGNHIYWTDSDTSSIGRANLDGTGANLSFITGAAYPSGVAVEGNYIYWTNSSGTSIGRANLDGSGANQSFITGASSPVGVAVEGNYIYWANNGSHSIARANLDGTGANLSFITGADYPNGLAVKGNYIYWTNASYATNTIARANLDGTGANQSFITGVNFAGGVAVDDNYIYWVIPYSNSIGRANLDGSGANPSFITGASFPSGLAVADPPDPPSGSLSPSSHDFGNRLVGTETTATFTLSSSASTALDIEAMGIGGSGDENFGIFGDSTCSIATTQLSSGQSCTIKVNFSPSSTGSKSATLDVQTNDGLKSVALTGTGTPIPTISGAGKPTKISLKVKVGCGDANTCTLQFTGKKMGTNAAITPKTVFVPAGQQPTVTLAYSRALKTALARGGRVSVTVTNPVSGGAKSIVVQVAR